jgi:N-acetylmuramoyl-L-alanine amidase-like protein
MGGKTFLQKLRRLALFLSILGYTSAAFSGTDTDTSRRDLAHRIASLDQRQLIDLIARNLQDAVNEISHKKNRVTATKTRVTVDLERKVAYLDLGADYILDPGTYISATLEEELQQIAQGLDWDLGPNPPIHNYEFLFGGEELLDLFPEEKRLTEEAAHAAASKSGPVVVAAAHGDSYHYGFKDWRPQRGTANGITEDYLSPIYAAELAYWMGKRSNKAVVLPRGPLGGNQDESGRPWTDMAAKYRIEKLLPDRPDIWDSLPASTDNLRNYHADIRARPFYANELNAEGLLHLHTNSHDTNPSIRGMRVYHVKGREEQKSLAESVLCSMTEIVHATSEYDSFPIASSPHEYNHGENRLAKMPSVIVETAFHTNPDDARALLDSSFRTASMKGVEKGYRLFTEGKKCEPFALTDALVSPIPEGAFIPIDAHFSGNPEFGVRLVIKPAECPVEGPCEPAELPYEEKRASPIRFYLYCGYPAEPMTHPLQVKIVDADNVETGWVPYTVNCPAASAGRHAPSSNGDVSLQAPYFTSSIAPRVEVHK